MPVDLSDVKIAPDADSVAANAKVLKAKRTIIEADLAVVTAMETANRSLCKHPGRLSYSDPRDIGCSYGACPVCGSSR